MKTFNHKAPLGQSILIGRTLSPWDKMFLGVVQRYGGFDNAHGHLCRADTITEEYLSHIYAAPLEAAALPLTAKQNMTGNLHDGIAYTEEDLRTRMSTVLERLISYGTTRFSTCIDVTPDIGEDGQLAFRIATELKAKYASQIELEIGPTPIFGLKEGTDRWRVFAEAAKSADFLAALPEKDDYFGVEGATVQLIDAKGVKTELKTNAAGNFLPPPREVRAVIEGQQGQIPGLAGAKTAANGDR